MIRQWGGSPKGRRPPAWSIIHIGSGHAVVTWQSHDPFKLATLLAEIGDWEFDGLEGYKNRDPQLPQKASALIATFPKGIIRFGGGYQDQGAAMAVAIANG